MGKIYERESRVKSWLANFQTVEKWGQIPFFLINNRPQRGRYWL